MTRREKGEWREVQTNILDKRTEHKWSWRKTNGGGERNELIRREQKNKRDAWRQIKYRKLNETERERAEKGTERNKRKSKTDRQSDQMAFSWLFVSIKSNGLNDNQEETELFKKSSYWKSKKKELFFWTVNSILLGISLRLYVYCSFKLL